VFKPFGSVILALENSVRDFGVGLRDVLSREDYVRVYRDKAASPVHSIGSIGSLVVEAAAEAWGIDPVRLFTDIRSSLQPVGKYGHEVIKAECIVLTRPRT
jgi:hypothetical protein